MSRTYELSAVNQSKQDGTFCLFQTDVAMGGRGLSLAWMTAMAAAGATVTFRWETTYQFVAGRMELRPGAVFEATETIDADPVRMNSVTLRYDNAPRFSDDSRGRSGSLTITTDGSISDRRNIAVGIGMSGSPLYAQAAAPMTAYVHSAEPRYRLAFGTFKPGEVLDPSLSSTAVMFPANRYALTVVLNANGSWSVS